MNFGKTKLCDVVEIKGRYQVTWGKHITGLDVYSEKVIILFNMIVKDMKGWNVGIMLSNGYVLWLSGTLIATLDFDTIVEYLFKVGRVKDDREIAGVIFDNPDDAETFIDRLEKKYIVHILKN